MRKQRTREHMIEDLGFNHVERQILYDAQKEVAYFEDLQVYFQKNRLNLGKGHKFVRIFIPMVNILTSHVINNIRLSLK